MLIEQTSVAASALPIAQFREHLRLGTGFSDAGLQDDLLETCLRSAISAIEARIGKALIEKRYLQSVSAWRDGDWHPISVAPVVDVISVFIIFRRQHINRPQQIIGKTGPIRSEPGGKHDLGCPATRDHRQRTVPHQKRHRIVTAHPVFVRSDNTCGI